jgi:hypothetical protein
MLPNEVTIMKVRLSVIKKIILVPFILAFVISLFAVPIYSYIQGYFLLFIGYTLFSFAVLIWMAYKGKNLNLKQKIVLALLALIFLVVEIVHLKDVPSYLLGTYIVTEGYPIEVRHNKRNGGAEIAMDNIISFRLGRPYLPPNPDIRKFRVAFLSHSHFIVKCEYEDFSGAWKQISSVSL